MGATVHRMTNLQLWPALPSMGITVWPPTAIAGEETPLLISGTGRYKCSVKARGDVLSREFVVSGEYGV